MPEPYEWEWLIQPPHQPTTEQHPDPVDKLRRWIEPVQPEQSDQTKSWFGWGERRQRPTRWQRRQQLRQMQSTQSIDFLPEPEARSHHELEVEPEVRSPDELEAEPIPTEVPLEPEVSLKQSSPEPDKNGAEKTMAKKKDDYREHLKQEFINLFENLGLQPQQKHYLKSRWLDQVLWMEGRAGKARDMHYRLRLTTIIGGVIIPALVSLNFTGNDQTQFKQGIAASTFILSQAVAICAATEQFFNYGDRWRHYRRSVESLKTQGWQFFELTGPYENSKTHEQAFSMFANQVEQILQHDVEIYSTQVTQAKQNEKQEEDQSPSGAAVSAGSTNFDSPASSNGRAPEMMRQP